MPTEELAQNPWLIAAGWLVLLTLAGSLTAWVWALARLRRGERLIFEGQPRIVPWGAGSVAAVAILYLLLNFAVGGAYNALRAKPAVPAAADSKSVEVSPGDQLALMVVINLLIVAMVPALLRLTSGARLADLGLAGTRQFGRDLARGAIASLMLGPIVYGLYLVAQRVWRPSAHPVQEALARDGSGVNAFLVAISAVVAAPLAEELLFRGVLLGWLTRAVRLVDGTSRLESPEGADDRNPAMVEAGPSPEIHEHRQGSETGSVLQGEPPTGTTENRSRSSLGPGAWFVNLVVAALFAGLHSPQWPAPLPLFVLAVGLGWLYQRTGRLVGPVALHATFNGFSTLMLLLVSASGVEVPRTAPPPVGHDHAVKRASMHPWRKVSRTKPVHLTAGGGDLAFSGGPPGASISEAVLTGPGRTPEPTGNQVQGQGHRHPSLMTRRGADHG